MSGRDADDLEKLIRQIFNRAIEIDGLAHQELKGLALAGQPRNRQKEIYWAVV